MHGAQNRLADGLSLGQAAELRIQGLELALGEVRGLQFGQLVAEQFGALLDAGQPGLQFLRGLAGPLPGPVRGGQRLPLGARHPVGIEQGQLHLLVRQPVMLALAVDVHQPIGQCAHQGQIHRRPVDEGARPPIPADHSAQQAALGPVRVGERLGIQALLRGGVAADVEFGA